MSGNINFTQKNNQPMVIQQGRKTPEQYSEWLPVNFAEQLNNMVNTKMRFGDFGASVTNLNAEYKCYYSPNFGFTSTEVIYKDDKGNLVAKANKEDSNGQTIATIYDYKTGRTYSTSLHSSYLNSSKFTTISGAGYKITDNGNGYVDANDEIYINQNRLRTTVGDFLNSQA